eukprot:351039-Chlamydomonas_euryale.AAC.1
MVWDQHPLQTNLPIPLYVATPQRCHDGFFRLRQRAATGMAGWCHACAPSMALEAGNGGETTNSMLLAQCAVGVCSAGFCSTLPGQGMCSGRLELRLLAYHEGGSSGGHRREGVSGPLSCNQLDCVLASGAYSLQCEALDHNRVSARKPVLGLMRYIQCLAFNALRQYILS